MKSTVRIDIENEIALVTIDNPPFNTYTRPMMADFTSAFRNLHERQLRAVVITGAGEVFQGGADINIFLETQTAGEGARFVQEIQGMLNAVAELACPVIAAVNGLAMGGGTELALACDIRIASTKAIFALPEVRYGIIPGAGGTQRAPRLMGPGRAKLMICSGATIDADEAFRLGLVERVVAPERILEEAMALAQAIAKRSPAAVQAAKRAIDEGLGVSLSEGLDKERDYLVRLATMGDMNEGAKAFLEKRSPDFQWKSFDG